MSWRPPRAPYRRLATVAGLMALAAVSDACRGDGETRARALCEKADAMAVANPRGALEIRRRVGEQMPTAGTAAARACLAPIRIEMGRVRVLVSGDEEGDPATIEGCAWAADVMEVFADSVSPPFKVSWTTRLMQRCETVVGRAWARAPDDPRLIALHERIETLAR